MTTNILRLSLGSACSALLLAASYVAPASAEDGKVYPSAFCAGALVGNPPIVSFSSDALTNTSTTNSAVVVCPTVKDNVFGSTGLNEANLRYCKAGSPGFLVDLRSHAPFGSSVALSSKSDFLGAGCRTFTWGALAGASEGFYTFMVVIPPSIDGVATKSKLISYRIDEN
jgi:hypothetical protein